jgi:acyl-coenzyme A thioesterase PaaI-like protein
MEQRTHAKIAPHLCGRPLELSPGRARVALETTAEMAADDRGLVHGGFTFARTTRRCSPSTSPPLVLASAQTKFLGPVVVGDRVEADAAVERTEGRKRWVKVTVRRDGQAVLEAELMTVVPDTHILDAPAREPRR